jgi:hypothetical protein
MNDSAIQKRHLSWLLAILNAAELVGGPENIPVSLFTVNNPGIRYWAMKARDKEASNQLYLFIRFSIEEAIERFDHEDRKRKR